MPRFKAPDPDSIIATHSTGTVLAVGPLATDPKRMLFRRVRVVLPEGTHKRSLWCSWIIPDARLARGGHAWLLKQQHPDIHAWVEIECAKDLTPEDALDAYGVTLEEWDAAVAEWRKAKKSA